MARVITSFVVLGVLAIAAAWLAERPGVVALNWQGYRIETTLALTVIVVALLMVVAALLYRVWRWTRRGPLVLGQARQERRQRQGQLALTQGMVAVAAGDRTASLRFARRAENLLDDLPLTMLLSAQAAQLNGDDQAAKRYFASMLERPEMEFLGLRGLMALATRAGNSESALSLARRAFLLRPSTPWVLTALFDLEAGSGHWVEAGRMADLAVKHKVITAEEGQRRKAITLQMRARAADAAGRAGEARKLSLEAVENDAHLIPAVALAARSLLANGKRRRAAHLIEETWVHHPGADLANIYGQVYANEKTARRMQRFEKLAAQRPSDPESTLALAEAAIAAERWELARRHLEPMATDDADERVCRLMAKLEEGERGPAYARTWLERAAAAPEGPRWVCGTCARDFTDWSAHCPHCRAFDSLNWERPGGPRALGAAMGLSDYETLQVHPPVHSDDEGAEGEAMDDDLAATAEAPGPIPAEEVGAAKEVGAQRVP